MMLHEVKDLSVSFTSAREEKERATRRKVGELLKYLRRHLCEGLSCSLLSEYVPAA